MNKDTALIRLENITKQYQMGEMTVHALRKINLEINQGEYMSILGPSGSGKSTLMNLLGCLDSPSSGHYFLSGKDVSHLSRNELAKIRSQQIGFIFQSFNLLEYGSALDNVALPLVYRGIRSQKRRQLAQAMLERVGLGDRIHHHPSELSGGQQQRVAIARALVTDPDLILADEPTGNLDSKAGEGVVQLFEALSQQGKTVIIVTHDLAMAERTRNIVTIHDGALVENSNNK